MRKKTIAMLAGAAIGVFASIGAAQTTTVRYTSNGFESASGFSTTGGYNPANSAPGGGYLYGQYDTNYTYTGASTYYIPWYCANTNSSNGLMNASIATVTTTPASVYQGTQGITFNRVSSDFDTFYFPYNPTTGVIFNGSNNVPTVPARYVDVTWNMKVATPSTNDPLFGIEAFGTGGTPLGFGGVDAGTGEFVFTTTGGSTVEIPGAGALNTWNGFDLRLDYSNDTEVVYVNGVPLSTPQPFSNGADNGFDYAGIGSISSLETNSVIGSPSAGTAYFDNYAITSTVPEPASAAMLAVGASIGLLRRRGSKFTRRQKI